jgi:DNA repair exonuclease SbcCD ATPase subunit
MPDTIERTIYKLEIDDSGYIRGIESLAASTAKFTQAQEAANKTLQTNEVALKINTDRLARAKKDLEDYTGTNARYRKQLENDVKSAERDQAKLTELVNNNRIAYEKATKAADDFAKTASKATTLQQGTGKIPVPSPIPVPGANIQAVLGKISLGDLPQSLEQTIPEFEELRKVIADAEAELSGLNQESDEFKQLKPLVDEAKGALQLYDDATKKAGS